MSAIVILSLFRFDSTHDVAELETFFGFGHTCIRGYVVAWPCVTVMSPVVYTQSWRDVWRLTVWV